MHDLIYFKVTPKRKITKHPLSRAVMKERGYYLLRNSHAHETLKNKEDNLYRQRRTIWQELKVTMSLIQIHMQHYYSNVGMFVWHPRTMILFS